MHERYLGRIQSGMLVCDAKGSKVGSVVRVYRYESTEDAAQAPEITTSEDVADEILEVKTGVFGLGRHLFVPLGAIEEVVSDSVFLGIHGLNDEIDQFKSKPEYFNRLH